MRRLFSFILIGFVALSCGPKDKNIGMVRKEFKNYVQKTFDDPKSLKEIVDISSTDTLSFEAVKGMCQVSLEGVDQAFQLYSMKDSIATAQLEVVYKSIRKTFNGGVYEAIQGQRLASDMISLLKKEIDAKKIARLNQSQMQKQMDSLTYHPALYVYEIKYRNQYSDGLKLESAFAYVDSLTGFRVILPQQNDNEVLCDEYQDAFDLSKKCLISINEIDALYKAHEEKWEEFSEFINRNSK